MKRAVHALMPAIAALALHAPATQAAVTDEQVQKLLERIEAQDRRIAELEKAQAAQSAPASAPAAAAAGATVAAPAAAPAPADKPAAASWTEKVSIQGDFRYRYENIDEDDKDERNRNRIRARAAIVAKPQPDLEVGFGLATGENNDPVSTNVTLGGGGTRKDIYVDLAYFRKQIFVPELSLTGGKFKNFLYRPGRHELVWDSDFNPEGLGLVYQGKTFFASALGSWLDGDSNGGTTFSAGGQAGFVVPFTDSFKLTAGLGYYDIGTAGKTIPYVVDDKVKYFGNSFACDPVGSTDPDDCFYLLDYQELEAFAELGFSLGDVPATLFLDYVQNQDADDNDTGYAAGFTVGQLKGKGTWEVFYAYQDLEADAVLGLFTASDFGGGGTDTRGHQVRGTYGFGDKWNLAFTYYLNDIGMDAGNERDYARLQLDLNVKY